MVSVLGNVCRRGALAGLVVILAGCAPEPPPPAPAPVAAIQPLPPPPVVVHRRPPAPPKPKPEQASREESAPTEPQPEASAATQPAAVPSATDLVGLDPQHATQLLGPAAATDTRSPATVWHYKSSRCELDLAFYMEMRSGQMRALHYDFKGGADNPEQRQACLKAIIEENRSGAGGKS